MDQNPPWNILEHPGTSWNILEPKSGVRQSQTCHAKLCNHVFTDDSEDTFGLVDTFGWTKVDGKSKSQTWEPLPQVTQVPFSEGRMRQDAAGCGRMFTDAVPLNLHAVPTQHRGHHTEKFENRH